MLRRFSVKSEDVKIGDMLFTSATPARVIEFKDYPGIAQIFPEKTARIAMVDNGFDMTLIDGSYCDIVR